MSTIQLKRVKGDFGFEAQDENGHTVRMDTSPESGGWDYGVRPMQMLLMGLGGCAGIDVISILKKQRQKIEDYKMVINGDREPGKEPSLWKTVTVEFHLYGKVDEDKAVRAVELAMSKYCSVAATLQKSGTAISTKVFVHSSSK